MHNPTRMDSSPLFKAILFTLLISLITLASALAAYPPPQPSEGPGGREYAHRRVIGSSYGAGPLGYYIFEPAEPSLDTAPVIVFIHGYTAIYPNFYGAWIEHIVKKGNIVIFPIYQNLVDFSFVFTSNSAIAVSSAIQELQTGNHTKPDLERFAIVGHSMGGVIAPSVAAIAQRSGLPAFKAVMSVQPGIHPFPQLEDLSQIPEDTLLLSVAGDIDTLVGNKDARTIFYRTTQIPLENKDYIIMVSDQYGNPPLLADHAAPGGLSFFNPFLPTYGVDALDYLCLWKLFDALTDAAFYGENREYALGNTPEQCYMGQWSDGVPVKEMIVTDTP